MDCLLFRLQKLCYCFLFSSTHCLRNDQHTMIFIDNYFAQQGEFLPHHSTTACQVACLMAMLGHCCHNFLRECYFENLIILYQPKSFFSQTDTMVHFLDRNHQHQCTLPNSLEASCISTTPHLKKHVTLV